MCHLHFKPSGHKIITFKLFKLPFSQCPYFHSVVTIFPQITTFFKIAMPFKNSNGTFISHLTLQN